MSAASTAMWRRSSIRVPQCGGTTNRQQALVPHPVEAMPGIIRIKRAGRTPHPCRPGTDRRPRRSARQPYAAFAASSNRIACRSASASGSSE